MIWLKKLNPYWRRKKLYNTSAFIEDCINKQFKIAGHKARYKDIIERKDNWYSQYTMTSNQQKVFERWFIKQVLARKIVCSAAFAEKEFGWFSLMWGLRIYDNE